jgi:hypothetical protein
MHPFSNFNSNNVVIDVSVSEDVSMLNVDPQMLQRLLTTLA